MPESATYYPPVAFHFELTVVDDDPDETWPTTEIDARFQEISGIERELEVDEVREGGENRFTHRLPKRGKHPNLVLKRGVVYPSSALADWAEATVGSDIGAPIKPRTLQVTLLSSEHAPLVVWTFTRVYPVKWVTSSFNATESKIAVETLEMAYAAVTRRIQKQASA